MRLRNKACIHISMNFLTIRAITAISLKGLILICIMSYLCLQRTSEVWLSLSSYRLVAAISLKATYDYSVLPKGDPFSSLLKRAATGAGEAGSFGATSVDLFPICTCLMWIRIKISCFSHLVKTLTGFIVRHVPPWFPFWFPGVLIKRHCIKTRALMEESVTKPFEDLKTRMVQLIFHKESTRHQLLLF